MTLSQAATQQSRNVSYQLETWYIEQRARIETVYAQDESERKERMFHLSHELLDRIISSGTPLSKLLTICRDSF